MRSPIDDIYDLTEPEAKSLAEESAEIKGFNIYFINFSEEGHFPFYGYSYLVYRNGRQIKYANDYELHHPGKTHEELRAMYVKALNGKLFTEEELAEPLKSYGEYKAKANFLGNYYPLQVDYVSIFGIFNTEEAKQEHERKIAGKHLDPVGFCYVDDPDFVRKHVALKAKLDQRYAETLDNFEYQKSAFLYEMYNHEYGINWQADWDVINCFATVPYKDAGTEWYLAQTGFTDVQKDAYREAKREYFRREAEAC